MLSRKIKCCGCKNEGEIEIIGLSPDAEPGLLFRYLGHHEFTGDMYFRCPHCGRELAVNPMETLGPGRINGVPRYGTGRPAATEHSTRKLFCSADNKPERRHDHVCTQKNPCSY